MRTILLSILVAVSSLMAGGYTIDNYDIDQTYKTAKSLYRVLGDTTLGHDVAVYSAATVTLQWPVRFGDRDVTALQDSLLLQFLMYPGHDADSALAAIMEHPLHFAEGTLLPVNTVPDLDGVLVLEYDLDVATVGYCDRFIVYRAEHFSNSGSVHPNYFLHYLNYDFTNNRVLTFNDIFVPSCESELLNIVKTALCDRYYAEDFDELVKKADIYTDELFVSRDVYLTGDQIVFSYDPYDIAPWAIGVVEVPVYVTELAPYLTPGVRALYGL